MCLYLRPIGIVPLATPFGLSLIVKLADEVHTIFGRIFSAISMQRFDFSFKDTIISHLDDTFGGKEALGEDTLIDILRSL